MPNTHPRTMEYQTRGRDAAIDAEDISQLLYLAEAMSLQYYDNLFAAVQIGRRMALRALTQPRLRGLSGEAVEHVRAKNVDLDDYVLARELLALLAGADFDDVDRRAFAKVITGERMTAAESRAKYRAAKKLRVLAERRRTSAKS